MTIELNFDNAETLRTIDFILRKGLQKYQDEVFDSYPYMNSETHANIIEQLKNIENAIKPIREAMDEVEKKEKYIQDYNTYLELKKRFESKV